MVSDFRITKTASGTSAGGYDIPLVPLPMRQFYLASVFELVDNFTIEINFEAEYEKDGTSVFAAATDVRSDYDWDAIGITFTKLSASRVRLTGPSRDVFANQYYRFKLADLTEQVLPFDTTESFLSLTQYQMPQPTSILLEYLFEADFPGATVPGAGIGLPFPPSTESITMYQWHYWNYYVAYAAIKDINSRGMK